MNLLKNINVKHVLDPIAAANNTDSNSSRLDMQGFEGVIFIVPVTDCTSGSVVTLTVEHNTSGNDSDTGMAAATGATATATSTAGDDLNGKLLVVDCYRPRYRYVQGVITTATQNAAIGNMIAIQYSERKMPITQGTTVKASTQVISPA